MIRLYSGAFLALVHRRRGEAEKVRRRPEERDVVEQFIGGKDAIRVDGHALDNALEPADCELPPGMAQSAGEGTSEGPILGDLVGHVAVLHGTGRVRMSAVARA